MLKSKQKKIFSLSFTQAERLATQIKNKGFKIYFDNLFECYKDFIDKWTNLRKIASHLHIPAFNVGSY